MAGKRSTVTVDAETLNLIKEVSARWTISKKKSDFGRITQGNVIKQLAIEELQKLKNESEEIDNEQNSD